MKTPKRIARYAYAESSLAAAIYAIERLPTHGEDILTDAECDDLDQMMTTLMRMAERLAEETEALVGGAS